MRCALWHIQGNIMKFKVFVTALIFICAAFHSKAVADTLHDGDKQPFSLLFNYTADIAGNAMGGIKTGAGFLGYGYTGLTFDSEKAGLWKGSVITITLGTTHGATPSESWVGDFQVADCIEAGTHVFLQDVNIEQRIGSMTFTLGQQDLCANYASCEPALIYLNSSFGLHSVASMNMDVPIFPVLGLGLNVKWDITDRLYAEAAVYDTPIGFDDGNPYNMRYRLGGDGGIIAGEVGYNASIGDNLHGGYKVGLIHQTNIAVTTMHACLWQEVWRNDGRCLTPFAIISYSPERRNEHYCLLSAGANFQGLFFADGRDVAGLGVSMAYFGHDATGVHHHHHETSIELTYRYDVCKYLSLQADMQYIVNPSADGDVYDDALFAGLRARISL